LRERGDDIVLVAKAFLHNYGVEHAKPGLIFAPDGAARDPALLSFMRPSAALTRETAAAFHASSAPSKFELSLNACIRVVARRLLCVRQ
jgi:hypothetical protein